MVRWLGAPGPAAVVAALKGGPPMTPIVVSRCVPARRSPANATLRPPHPIGRSPLLAAPAIAAGPRAPPRARPRCCCSGAMAFSDCGANCLRWAFFAPRPPRPLPAPPPRARAAPRPRVPPSAPGSARHGCQTPRAVTAPRPPGTPPRSAELRPPGPRPARTPESPATSRHSPGTRPGGPRDVPALSRQSPCFSRAARCYY